jgi:hypothetical protein
LTRSEAESLQGKLCEANVNPDDVNPNCADREGTRKWTPIPKIDPAHPDAFKEVSFVKANSALDPGGDYGFCIVNPKPDPKTKVQPLYCLPIHVEVPMFDTPYVFIKGTNGNSDVAIFSVVDPQIRSYLPKQNAGWDVLDSSDRAVMKKSEPLKCEQATVLPVKDKACWIPHRVEIDTLPPDVALQQAFDAFSLDKPYNGTTFSGITVLLAQMDRASAEELALHIAATDALKLNIGKAEASENPAFDLVIARSEHAHETRNQTISLPRPCTACVAPRPRFIAVPPPVWNEEIDKKQMPLGRVHLTRATDTATAEFFNLAADIPEAAVNITPAWTLLESRLFQGTTARPYSGCYNKPPQLCSGTEIAACLMKFATCAMLQDSKAYDTEGSDIAILQPRDIWVPKDGAWQTQLAIATTVQGALDRIFWKDDLLSFTNLSGSQLKALIKDSAKIANDEKNPLWILRDTMGRKLAYSGLVQGEVPKPGSTEPSLYSHLEEVPDASIYRVAASSYISNGDTGYTEFASPAQGKTDFFNVHTGKNTASNAKTSGTKNSVGVRISVLVCEALAGSQEVAKSSLYGCGKTETQQESIAQSPPSPPCLSATTVDETCYAVSRSEMEALSGLWIHDNREQDGAKEYLEAQVNELTTTRDPFSTKGKGALPVKNQSERDIQSYPYWDINLRTLSLSGMLNSAVASKADTAKFSGVQQSDVSQSTRSEFAAKMKLTVLWRNKNKDYGFAVDQDFDKSVTGGSPNWSPNTFAVGPLWQYSFTDPRRTPRWLFAAHPIDYIGQITNTNLSLSGDPKTSTAAPFNLRQLASRGFWNKGGLRFESGGSYFELGGIHKKNYDVLSELDGLKVMNGSNSTCVLNGKNTPESCIKGLTYLAGDPPPTLRYKTRDQAGLYWDGQFSLEVLKGKWTYILTSTGNYLPGGDQVSTLTLLDAKIGNSLQFPLIGNLSLAPKFEWRFFENQGAHDFLNRVNTSIALTYSFHKDSRVRFKDALRYKSPASAP